MEQTRIHPETGQTLTRSVRKQTVRFAALSTVVDVPGWYPDGDGDSIHSGPDLEAKDEAFQALRKQYGERVRKIRKSLRLTQVEAGALLGGGPRAFQKYEKGQMAPSDAAVGLLEILRLDPEKLQVLQDLRNRQPSQ